MGRHIGQARLNSMIEVLGKERKSTPWTCAAIVDGVLETVVAKFEAPDNMYSMGIGEQGFATEVLLLALFRQAGGLAPKPVILEIQSDEAEHVSELVNAHRDDHNSMPIQSGCKSASLFMPNLTPFLASKVGVNEASLILVFDCITLNSDRTGRNPNLAMKGKSTCCFDFEAGLDPKRFQMNENAVDRVRTFLHGSQSNHILKPALKRHSGLAENYLRDTLGMLGREDILGISSEMPDHWVKQTEFYFDHLSECFECLDEIINEVKKWVISV